MATTGLSDVEQRIVNPLTSKQHVARVTESRARAQRERAALAAAFRARLMKELSIDGSASQEALIDCAVSARVEISVVTTRFLRCCATTDERDRLGRARGELIRALRALGLPKANANEADVPPADASHEVQREWAKQYVARRLTEVEP